MDLDLNSGIQKPEYAQVQLHTHVAICVCIHTHVHAHTHEDIQNVAKVWKENVLEFVITV